MAGFKFNHVCIESFGVNIPPNEVSSAEIEDKLSPLYNKLEIPFGTLEKVSGIKTRRFWERSLRPSQAGTVAAKIALEQSGLDPKILQALFSCSVSRDYFEPATASLIHGALGLNENAMVFDISNACIGFSNGLITLGNLIEQGAIKAGIVVSAETISSIVDASLKNLTEHPEGITRERLLRLLPAFTLGSGAAAMVLCHESISRTKHRLLGSATRSASQHSDLCVGNSDVCATMGEALTPIMETDSQKLISEGTKLGARTWPEFSELLGWSEADIKHVFCHQVGKQLGAQFYRDMGIPGAYQKEYIVYPRYGNQVSAALPTALIEGTKERAAQSGDKLLLTAFGSGLNAIFTGIEW